MNIKDKAQRRPGLPVAAAVVLLLTTQGAALAEKPASPSRSAATSIELSTAAAAAAAALYPVERLRDPFLPSSVSGASKSEKPFTLSDFNIHNLVLVGLMKDARSDYAVFVDNDFGVNFILRKGKLLDEDGKALPGVSGSINLIKQTAHLMTEDGDVQIFMLGEGDKS